MSLLLEEFCSNFRLDQCRFSAGAQPASFFDRLAAVCKNSLAFCLQIGALHNGFGYFFEQRDYKALAEHFLFALAIFAARKHPQVRSAARPPPARAQEVRRHR